MPPTGYASIEARRQAVTIAFTAFIVLSAVAFISTLFELNLLGRIEDGDVVTQAEADNNDVRQGIVGFLYFVSYVSAAVVFLRWLRAAYRGVDALAPGLRRYGHGWVIGGWLVPILNFWRPKEIVNDVWEAGREGVQPDDDRRPPRLLLAWWLAFLAAGIIDGIAFQLSGGFDDAATDAQALAAVNAVGHLWSIGTAVLAILVVQRATDRLETRAREQAAAPPPPSPWGGRIGEWAPPTHERPQTSG